MGATVNGGCTAGSSLPLSSTGRVAEGSDIVLSSCFESFSQISIPGSDIVILVLDFPNATDRGDTYSGFAEGLTMV